MTKKGIETKETADTTNLRIGSVMLSAFVGEDDNNKTILVFADTIEDAEKKLETKGIESYMLRYLIEPDIIVY